MEQLKTIKECLIGVIQSQMSHLDQVDAEELGEVVDMVKDIEEAIYYCTITKAMEEKDKEYRYQDRDMDRSTGKMYYSEMPSRMYSEEDKVMEYPMMRDKREGKSPMSRRTYMEAREMHQPKTTQMKELEKYLQELSSDIVEMIQDASPEEKSFLEKKISALATKINQS